MKTLDRKLPQNRLTKPKQAERVYARQLKRLAEHVGHIIGGFPAGDPAAAPSITAMLRAYADTLTPWAVATAAKMVDEVNRRDLAGWKKISAEMSTGIQRTINQTPVGEVMKKLMAEQVTLIKSIPLNAAQRVHELTIKGLEDSTRAREIADEIMRSGEVARSRAMLIARTEVSRTASNLTQARAQNIGSTHYIWRTSEDGAVREDHKHLNGKIFAWADPPIADERAGVRANPGTIYNCFPGSTKVRLNDRIRKIIRSKYEGRVVNIRTPLGTVTATPNHPVLTSRGWIAIGEIKQGDYLLQPLGNAVGISESNEDESHASFDDLFLAFSDSRKTVGGVPFDFYGDIPNGDVDVVVLERDLLADFISQRLDGACNLGLAKADAVMVGGDLHVEHMSRTGITGKLPALFKRHGAHTDDVRLAARPDVNASSNESGEDGRSGYSAPIRDRQDAFPGAVRLYHFSDFKIDSVMGRASAFSCGSIYPSISEFFAQNIGADSNLCGSILKERAISHEGLRVIDCFDSECSGHVYTLETVDGWYEVGNNNIISKNCRCYAEPIITEE